MALTPKQQLFVEHYLVSLNATEAAKAAGYSAKTAHQQGAENLTKPDIQKAIQEAINARAKRIEVNADWVLKRLVAYVNADLDDILTADGAIKDVIQWPKAFRKGLVAGIEIFEEKDREGNILGFTKKIKLADRLRPLEMIGRHLGMFKDKVEHSGEVKTTPIAETVEAIAARLIANAEKPKG